MLKLITCYVILSIPFTLSEPRLDSSKPLSSLTKTVLTNPNVPRLGAQNVHATYYGKRRHDQAVDRYQLEMEDRQWDLEWEKHANKVKKQRAKKKEEILQKWALNQEKATKDWIKDKQRVSRELEAWANEQDIIRNKESMTQTVEELTNPRHKNKQKARATEEDISIKEYEAIQKAKEKAKQKERAIAANAEEILKALELTRQNAYIQNEYKIQVEMATQKANALKEQMASQKANAIKEEMARQNANEIKEEMARQKANAMKEEKARQKARAIKEEKARQKAELQKVINHEKKRVTKSSKQNSKAVEALEQKNVTEKKNKQEQTATDLKEEYTKKPGLDIPDLINNEDFFFRIGKYDHDDSLAYDLDGSGLRVSWD